MKAKLPRFIIQLDGKEITRVSSLFKMADFFGCSKQYVYTAIKDGHLNYQGNRYEIIDLLQVNNNLVNTEK